MFIVQILEQSDLIDPESLCRPLKLFWDGDTLVETNTYSGTPENNLKWIKVKYILGPHWYGKRIIDFHKTAVIPYEFLSKDSIVPHYHMLETDNFKSFN